MHPTAELAELTLRGDLLRLDTERYTGVVQRDALVASALESVEVLEASRGFSEGPVVLREIRRALEALGSAS